MRLIRQCLSNILEKTDYPNYEILLVDEDTSEKQARFAGEARYMQDRRGSLLLNDPAYSPNLTLDRFALLEASPPDAEYIAFCDQDDV
ncbi:MAG: hypothetical protein DDT21_02321 [Syntrophomonadaceae bacterium]|nr:hypothetical protein [Bacillota bacterium]